MKIAKTILAAGVAAVLAYSAAAPAEAGGRSYHGFGFLGPGLSFHIGPLPGYRSHRPHYGDPFYAEPYSRSYRSRRTGSRCGHWGRRCAANWGRHNADYYGCMRYHGCR